MRKRCEEPEDMKCKYYDQDGKVTGHCPLEVLVTGSERENGLVGWYECKAGFIRGNCGEKER